MGEGRKFDPRCFRGVEVRPEKFEDELSTLKEFALDNEDQDTLNSEE